MGKFQDLQKKAKEMGINSLGMNKEALEKAVADKGAELSEANTAVVMAKGGNEVRRYSLKVHGENFGELAKEFAKKNSYSVAFVKS